MRNINNRDFILDYLIPVINLMVRKKISHTEAFKEIADKLHVTRQTVNDRCARGLGINTQQFADLVKSGGIKAHLLKKFPDKANMINDCL